MKSVATMIDQLVALVGTSDLSPWERKFVGDMDYRTGPLYSHSQSVRSTVGLSAKQVEMIEQIYTRHFGDAQAA